MDGKIKQWIVEKGIIYKRRSNWSFPLLGAPKKDLEGIKTEIRVCWDGRKLNTLLKDSQYTMPLISKSTKIVEIEPTSQSLIWLRRSTNYRFTQICSQCSHSPGKGVQYCYARCPFGIKTIPAFIQKANGLNSVSLSPIFADALSMT